MTSSTVPSKKWVIPSSLAIWRAEPFPDCPVVSAFFEAPAESRKTYLIHRQILYICLNTYIEPTLVFSILFLNTYPAVKNCPVSIDKVLFFSPAISAYASHLYLSQTPIYPSRKNRSTWFERNVPHLIVRLTLATHFSCVTLPSFFAICLMK